MEKRSDMCTAANATTVAYGQRIQVPYHYPVTFTRNVLDFDNSAIVDTLSATGPGPHRCLAYLDQGLTAANPQIADALAAYARQHAAALQLACAPKLVPGGEQVKDDWTCTKQVLADLERHRIDRKSFVLVFGGGAVLDAVGLGAALAHRGVRLVRFPSTALAQGDAGVGVKNGINLNGVKNFIGTFNPPFAVINDCAFLRTLPRDVLLDGMAEAFKMAIIKDAEFFDALERQAPKLGGADWDAVEEAVYRCAVLHLDHIRDGNDPFEMGTSRPLDFGHWSAHRLEGLSRYKIRHGQAVAIGIALDSHYAWRKGLITRAELDRILDAFRRAGLPLYHELLAKREADGTLAILEGLRQFREHLGGALAVTMPDGIGRKVEVHELDAELIEAGVRFLGERA